MRDHLCFVNTFLCIILDSIGIGGNAYRRGASHLRRKASPIDRVPRPALEQNCGHLWSCDVTKRSMGWVSPLLKYALQDHIIQFPFMVVGEFSAQCVHCRVLASQSRMLRFWYGVECTSSRVSWLWCIGSEIALIPVDLCRTCTRCCRSLLLLSCSLWVEENEGGVLVDLCVGMFRKGPTHPELYNVSGGLPSLSRRHPVVSITEGGSWAKGIPKHPLSGCVQPM